VAVVVGLFIGTVGVGGVLLIPFLVLLGGLDIHAAAATALFSFLFTGLAGTWLYQRRGSIDWRMASLVCAGALVFGYLGAAAAAHIDSRPLTLLIAAIIIFAGIYAFLDFHLKNPPMKRGQLTLLTVGVVSGFGSGLSGAGGPLFSVPLMVILGFGPLAAIGVSQVLQIVAALSGSAASFQDGRIDFALAAWVSAIVLRRLAAALCVAVGAFTLVRAL
jgi:uncharacterized membrane protein YfcA